MEFTAMSARVFSGLAILAAGTLAALQYLRVKPQRKRVVTSLFWRQAVEQDRARSLFERFRHPRTYLLLLAASLLVLLALAAPVWQSGNTPHRVIALEAGLHMSGGDDRFENALALVRTEARSTGEERVAVIAADPQPRVLKRFDESLAAMTARLDRMKPADAPVIREDLLGAAESLLAGRENGGIVLVAAQPTKVDNRKVRVLAAGGKLENAFIFSAIFAPDSDNPTRGTLHCRVGFTGGQATTVNTTVFLGNDILSKQGIAIGPGGTKEITVPNIAADGALLTVALDGNDAIAGDDRIAFQLPNRRRIRVVPVAGYEPPPVLAAVLKSLPEVFNTSDGDGPLIRVGPAGSDAGIQIQAGAAPDKWLPVRAGDHHLVAGLEFEDAVCRAPGVASSAGIPLLLADGFALASLDTGRKRLTVANSLLDPHASIVRRTGYVVFWATMLQHLAGWHDEALTLSPVQGTRSTDPDADPLVMLPLLLMAWQLRGAAGSNKKMAGLLRLLALSLVIVALARPFHNPPAPARQVVAVVDGSSGMDDASFEDAAAGLRKLSGLTNMRLVVFGAHAREVPLGENPPTGSEPAAMRSAEPGSAIAGALALAASLCPDDAGGELHLFSDGRETRGNMLAAAAQLGRRGLELTTHGLGVSATAPALLTRVRPRARPRRARR